MNLREMELAPSRVDALDPPRLGLSVCSNSLTIPGALGRLLSCRQIGHAIAAWARRTSC